jgi:hypothetical protein
VEAGVVAGEEGGGEAKAAARRHFLFFFRGSKMRLHYLFVRHFYLFLNYRHEEKSRLWPVGADVRATWILAHLSLVEDRSRGLQQMIICFFQVTVKV